MTNIFEIAGVHNKYKTKGEWGLEIEVEGNNLPGELDPVLTGVWHVTADGSLRGESHEYVMPKPLDKKGVRASLDTLATAYRNNVSAPVESIRAGVHVHMNVQTWTLKQVMTFITIYFVMEELLVRWCGREREGNLFCLRLMDAEQILFNMHLALENKNLKYLNTDEIRYCSINPVAMFKYGSLEFRAMRSTPQLDIIYQWVEILEQIRDNSFKFDNPVDVLMRMSGDGEDAFLRSVLPNNYKDLMFDGYEKSIRNGARSIQSLAFTTDWDSISKNKTNPFDLETSW